MNDPENPKKIYYKMLWLQYEAAYKGKNLLTTSRGLYALYEVKMKEDKELNEEFDERSYLLSYISSDAWYLITKHNLFFEVLKVSDTHEDLQDFNSIKIYLKECDYSLLKRKKRFSRFEK
jgi:hypothetical protein